MHNVVTVPVEGFIGGAFLLWGYLVPLKCESAESLKPLYFPFILFLIGLTLVFGGDVVKKAFPKPVTIEVVKEKKVMEMDGLKIVKTKDRQFEIHTTEKDLHYVVTTVREADGNAYIVIEKE